MKREASQYLELSGPRDSMEIEAVFSFNYEPGCGAHYGSLSYAGHPAEPDSVEDVEVAAIYPILKNARGNYVRGAKLELTQWLEDFCLSAISEDELMEAARDD